MNTISDKELIEEYQSKLFKTLSINFNLSALATIKAVAVPIDLEVYHDNEIWYGYQRIKGRHLNVFGVLSERKNIFFTEFQLSIPCDGTNKRMGGIFGECNNDVSVLYRGHITGKTGVAKHDFMGIYPGRKCILTEENTEVIELGKLNDPDLLQKIFNYMRIVKNYKQEFRLI